MRRFSKNRNCDLHFLLKNLFIYRVLLKVLLVKAYDGSLRMFVAKQMLDMDSKLLHA